MWFIRSVVGASVFIMFICITEAKPQNNVDVSGKTYAELIDALTLGITSSCGGSSPNTSNGNCTCVPLKECCGPADDPQTNSAGDAILAGLVDERSCLFSLAEWVDDRFLIHVGDRNAQCDDILSVCCETPCKTTPPTTVKPSTNECGIRNQDGIGVRVHGFNDNQAQLGEFPWMVAVMTTTDDYVAGGSLVHPRVILTAGHKFEDKYGNNKKEAKDLVARIGDWDLSATNEPIPSQNISVERIVFHPEFNRPTYENNVALLILESDASLGGTVRTICLPEPGQNFDGADCVVTGWGKRKEGGKYQKILKKVSVPAVSHSTCQTMLRTCCSNILRTNFNLHDTFNCAGGNGEDVCVGDGGSPLVCPDPSNPNRYVQMGVVAWGIGCGKDGHPEVFGSIPATVEWINKVIQDEVVSVGFDIRSKPVSK